MASAEQTLFASIGLGMLLGVIFSLLLLPYIYVSIKYLMEPATHFHKLIFKSYGKGLKHWGYIFLTMLVTGICLILISFIISLPLCIAIIAMYLSTEGVKMGDESGLPSYFTWMMYLVFAITYFIETFMLVFVTFVAYYMYGSIETREKEKEALMKTNEAI